MAEKKRLWLILDRASPIEVYVITKIILHSKPAKNMGKVSSKNAHPSPLKIIAKV
tara:strand:+ start:518 stop:682 length:165 start_codon:yes stop_codon:yes gene_type:complete